MNHNKIHSLIVEQHDDLALLQWFLDRGDDRACRDIIKYLHILGDDIDRLEDNPMEKRDLDELIDQYIDQEGITKTCAHIMTILVNRLDDKLKIIEPVLSFLDDKEEDIYTEKDGRSIKGDSNRVLDSIPSGAYKAHPNPVTPEEEVPTGNRLEPAVTPCNLEGLTLILEREYRK